MTKKTYIAPVLDIFEEEAEELLEASAGANTASVIVNDVSEGSNGFQKITSGAKDNVFNTFSSGNE